MDDKELQMQSFKSGSLGRVPFFEVFARHLSRFLTLCALTCITRDVDSVGDLLDSADLGLMLFIVVFFGCLCRDCYVRFRTGCWPRYKGVTKHWWSEVTCWIVVVSIVMTVSWLVEAKMQKETAGGVKWRYEVSDGNAIIGRGRSWSQFRAAIPTTTDGDVEIPQVLGDMPVAGIGDYAFYKCKKLKSIAVPKGVTNVACNAFNECPVRKIYAEKGDAERVRALLRGKGIDVDKVEFVEREEPQK